MRGSRVLIVLAVCLLALPMLEGTAQAGRKWQFPFWDRDTGWQAPRIVNQVVDLLDDEVVLQSIDGPTEWESATFETAAFDRMGLRLSVDNEGGWVTCRACWMYGPDDECLDGVPAVSHYVRLPGQIQPGDPVNPLGGDVGLRRPDGYVDLYLQRPYYPYVVPNTSFSEVQGLYAKVRCYLSIWPIYGVIELGDDPEVEPGEPDPIETTATLTDVRVLLRAN